MRVLSSGVGNCKMEVEGHGMSRGFVFASKCEVHQSKRVGIHLFTLVIIR